MPNICQRDITLTRSSRLTIKEFASEYHNMKLNDGDGVRQTISLVGLSPWPELSTRDEKPDVVFWLRDVYQRTIASQPKGDMDGNATTTAAKNRPGRPRKSTDPDSLGIQGDTHKHLYLEREDGTPISVLELRVLSQRAHSLWQSLHTLGFAPRTWGKITSIAWEYYARSMLNEPGLEFLRLCDDGQWKLREWTQLNYSPWAKRNRIREARPKKEPEDDNPLNNEELIQMEPSDEEVRDDITHKEDADPHNVDKAQHEANTPNQTGDSGRTSQEANPSENLRPNVHPLTPL